MYICVLEMKSRENWTLLCDLNSSVVSPTEEKQELSGQQSSLSKRSTREKGLRHYTLNCMCISLFRTAMQMVDRQ